MIGDRVFVVLYTFDEATLVYSVHASREGADAVVAEFEARKAAIESHVGPAPGGRRGDPRADRAYAKWVIARQAAYDAAGILLGMHLEVWQRGYNAEHDEPPGFEVKP